MKFPVGQRKLRVIGFDDAPFTKKRGAYFLRYVLRSAIAQAEQANVDPGRLFVSESRVDEAPTIKRFQPKDRGRSHPILKRNSHLIVGVDVR